MSYGYRAGVVEMTARGMVITPQGVVSGEVFTADGRIVEVRPAALDGSPPWVCPGFIDIQINGSHGIDIATMPHRITELARRLPAEGTTAFLPTVITCPHDQRARVLDVMRSMRGRAPDAGSAVAIGLHLEGPLLSPARAGAHPVEHLSEPARCPTSDWAAESGVALVTIAPELPGALELIRELVATGVVVSLGHTDATAHQFQAGLDAGASAVTHLFNAMRPFAHRDPGPIGATFADDSLVAGLICDGIHVDPVAVAMAWRSLGPDRLVLVTDAVAARGERIHVDGVRTAGGVLAGSAIRLDEALAHLVAFTGASVADAVRTVTATPARLLGLDDRGAIVPGARADLTVLDRELRVIETFVAGVAAAGVAEPPPRR
jgi:N-acetylglucosamine-6-phosphate deacetylase